MESLKRHQKYLLLLVLAFLVMLFFYGRIDHNDTTYKNWDLKHYCVMAESAPEINQDISQPFAYRILGPWLAGTIPLQNDVSFYLLSIAGILTLLIIFYYYLIRHDTESYIALIITTAFLCNPYFIGLNTWDYFQLNDTLILLTILISFIFIEKKNWIAVTIALMIGSFARETWLLIIPAGLIYARQNLFGKRDFFLLSASFVPALILMIIIRIFVNAEGGLNLYEAFISHSDKLLHPGPWLGLTINSILPLTPIPVIFYRQTVKFLTGRKDLIVLYILVFISTLFGSDNERLMAPAFIAVYPLAAYILNEVNFREKVFVSIFLVLSFLNSFHLIYGRFTFPDETTMKLVRLGILAISAGLFLVYRKYKTNRVSDAPA